MKSSGNLASPIRSILHSNHSHTNRRSSTYNGKAKAAQPSKHRLGGSNKRVQCTPPPNPRLPSGAERTEAPIIAAEAKKLESCRNAGGRRLPSLRETTETPEAGDGRQGQIPGAREGRQQPANQSSASAPPLNQLRLNSAHLLFIFTPHPDLLPKLIPTIFLPQGPG